MNLFHLLWERFEKLISYVRSDLGRYIGQGNTSIKNMFKYYFLIDGFRFTFWLRLSRSNSFFVRNVAKFQHYRLGRKFNIDIPTKTQIGYGLYLGHGRNIVINGNAVLGNNVNISHFCSIGTTDKKAASIGDCVYLGPNSCVVGNVIIGSEVKVGAGAVVIKDVPDFSTAVGVPSKVVSKKDIYNDLIKNKYL